MSDQNKEEWTIRPPEQSEWSCYFVGLTYRPQKGKEPNFFHRFMHKILLGIKWTKGKR
jgi:hypothetical protein